MVKILLTIDDETNKPESLIFALRICCALMCKCASK